MGKEFFKEKYSWEEYHNRFDFNGGLNGGEGVASAAMSVLDREDNTDVTTTLLNVINQKEEEGYVYFWIQAGEVGHTYKIICEAQSDLNPNKKLKMEGYITII